MIKKEGGFMKSVLVIDDDNPEIAELVKMFLNGSNYYATVVYDSKEAWSIINTQITADVVIAGGHKGFDLLIRISLDPRLRSARLVLMSGYDLSDKSSQIGARFLFKPFSQEELLEVLK